MFEPSEFGKFLKAKRKAACLTQDEVATAIGKTGQYVSNIEHGKNNAPPNSSDIETLIITLNLSNSEAKDFRRLAAADRNQLSSVQMAYLLTHKSLLALIDYGVQNEVNDSCWEDLFIKLSNASSSLNSGDNQ